MLRWRRGFQTEVKSRGKALFFGECAWVAANGLLPEARHYPHWKRIKRKDEFFLREQLACSYRALKSQMFYRLATLPDGQQRINPDSEMRIDERRRNLSIAFCGLYPVRNHRLVGH